MIRRQCRAVGLKTLPTPPVAGPRTGLRRAFHRRRYEDLAAEGMKILPPLRGNLPLYTYGVCVEAGGGDRPPLREVFPSTQRGVCIEGLFLSLRNLYTITTVQRRRPASHKGTPSHKQKACIVQLPPLHITEIIARGRLCWRSVESPS